MTIQALAWAFDQPIPGTARLVLMGLANCADHTTGRVDFDAAMVAGVALVREPSLWRYLGALERNGYLAKEIRRTAEGEKREYWLTLDRAPAPWNWSAQDGDAEDSDAPVPESAPPNGRGFDRAKQVAARAAAKAEEPDRSQGISIIEGSKAHRAWCDSLRAQRKLVPFAHSMIVNGKEFRGFYMPTLFPPVGNEQHEPAA